MGCGSLAGRVAAAHLKRARTEPRPANTHHRVRSSGPHLQPLRGALGVVTSHRAPLARGRGALAGRVAAAHLKRARTEPRPANTHHRVRSSGPHSQTLRGALGVVTSHCAPLASGRGALAGRVAAAHLERSRTQPRPVNTHDWARSSGPHSQTLRGALGVVTSHRALVARALYKT